MKINKYMHDHGISAATLARVAAKNYRNGALNPNAFRRKPLSEEQILGSRMLNHPLTQYMFCAPDEGAAAVVLCRADQAHRYTDKPIYLRASAVRTRRLGAFEVHSPWLPIEETAGPTVDVSRAAFETAGIGPEDVDVIQLQDTDAGAEVIHLAENGFCADGEQEKLVADGRARDRRPAAREHRRRADRERRADRRLGAAPGPRGGAAAPRPGGRAAGAGQARRSATHNSTAHPASRACRSCPSDCDVPSDPRLRAAPTGASPSEAPSGSSSARASRRTRACPRGPRARGRATSPCSCGPRVRSAR